VAKYLGGLAVALIAHGAPADALPLLERAVKITEVALGSDHPDTESLKEALDLCSRSMPQSPE
jgi:hypothetical protein